MSDFNDEELISYARMHSTTERALFAAGHVNRLLALAGLPMLTDFAPTSFVAVHEGEMTDLINKIREKQTAKRPTEESVIREALLRTVGVLTIQEGRTVSFSRIDTDFNIFTNVEFSFDNGKLSEVKVLSHIRPAVR